ncbi:hypothetical protein QBA75_00645 [Streptomyces stelliscabiei]
MQITVAVDELTLTICTLMVHTSPHEVDGPTLLARLCGPPAARTVSGSGEEREVAPLILPETLVLDGLRMRRERAFLDECRAMGIRVEARRPVTKAAGEHITGRLAALFGAELTALTRQPTHDDTSLITWLQDRAEQWAESVWQHQPQAGLQAVGGPTKRHTVFGITRPASPGSGGYICPGQTHGTALVAQRDPSGDGQGRVRQAAPLLPRPTRLVAVNCPRRSAI